MACKIDFDLNNGMKMPALGLGTWRVSKIVICYGLEIFLYSVNITFKLKGT